MSARPTPSRFAVLYRTFLAQFFASESATSDHAVRQAVIGIIAFLIVPGLLIPLQMDGQFNFTAARFPSLLEPLIRLMATIFVTYAIVSIGVIAAFAWDALGFDRRDAMVIGPLPVGGATVIAAKLAALATLLLGTSAVMTLITAVSFSMVAGNRAGFLVVGRHFSAHVIATMAAATFVFSVLVTIRALLGMVRGGRIAIASLVQFALFSALLCFVVMVPTAFKVTFHRGAAPTVYMQPIPAWSPTNWFLGLYKVVRVSNVDQFGSRAVTAIEATLLSIAAAVLATIASYRRQLQLALTPAASAGSHWLSRLQLGFARALAGADPVARAASDFVLMTMMRSRAQQAPIAINTAIAVAVAAAALARAGGDLASLMQPRTIVLWIPLLAGYWMTIGVRASFFVPSELAAAWTFRANGPAETRAYWAGTRAAMMAFVMPPSAAIAALVTTPLLGWRLAAWHAAFVVVMIAALIELVALTIDALPFTRPYRPGHANLKARWPIYLLGMFAFAAWPARLELHTSGVATVSLLAYGLAAVIVLDLIGRWRGRRWAIEPPPDFAEDSSEIAVLNISAVPSSP